MKYAFQDFRKRARLRGDLNTQARIQAGALPARAPPPKKKRKKRERERERRRRRRGERKQGVNDTFNKRKNVC